MPQVGTAFCIIALVKRARRERIQKVWDHFLQRLEWAKNKTLVKCHLHGEMSLCHPHLFGLELPHTYFGFSLVRQPNCAKYGSDIIEQGSFIAAIFGEFIHVDISQIACTFNGQQSNVESDY